MKVRKRPIRKPYQTKHVLFIETRRGMKKAMPGDWIITDLTGKVTICKPDKYDMMRRV